MSRIGIPVSAVEFTRPKIRNVALESVTKQSQHEPNSPLCSVQYLPCSVYHCLTFPKGGISLNSLLQVSFFTRFVLREVCSSGVFPEVRSSRGSLFTRFALHKVRSSRGLVFPSFGLHESSTRFVLQEVRSSRVTHKVCSSQTSAIAFTPFKFPTRAIPIVLII